jgi:hypothetical protein
MSGTPIPSDELTATGRVPAEHRVFGLDRRTLLPGLVVTGVFLVWVVLIPAINSALSYDQTTKAGDVFLLAPGVEMQAQQGWGVEKGLLASETTRSKSEGDGVLLVNGGVSFEITPGPYEGDVRPLLDSIDKVTAAAQSDEAFTVGGDVQSFETTEGHPGLLQTYTTKEGEGVIGALVYGETGLQITAAGPSTEPESKLEEIAQMIASISYEGPAE